MEFVVTIVSPHNRTVVFDLESSKVNILVTMNRTVAKDLNDALTVFNNIRKKQGMLG